jgi:hypothetical protein
VICKEDSALATSSGLPGASHKPFEATTEQNMQQEDAKS